MDKEQKETKKKFDHITIPLAILKIICQKFGIDKDGVGWRRVMLVYAWIWTWQILCKVGFGKARKKDVYDQIEKDLIEPKPHVVVAALIKAGLVVWGRGEYNGKKSFCLQCTYLNEKMGNSDINADEVAMTVVESVKPQISIPQQTETVVEDWKREPKNGVYRYCGCYYYIDVDGNRINIPSGAAFNRPSIEHVFDFEAARWCLPNELSVYNGGKLDF